MENGKKITSGQGSAQQDGSGLRIKTESE